MRSIKYTHTYILSLLKLVVTRAGECEIEISQFCILFEILNINIKYVRKIPVNTVKLYGWKYREKF
jgi:hypothetical protein